MAVRFSALLRFARLSRTTIDTPDGQATLRTFIAEREQHLGPYSAEELIYQDDSFEPTSNVGFDGKTKSGSSEAEFSSTLLCTICLAVRIQR